MYAPNPALYLSPEMITELALGQDPPLDIAQKYGFTAAEFAALNAQAWFGEAVYRKREDLAANGISFAQQAAMMAQEMWQDIYVQSKTTEGMRMEHRLEAAKQLTDIGGLKPKTSQANTGPAFTITIQLPNDPQKPSLRKVEQVDKPDEMVIDMTPVDRLPEKPPGLKIPDFKMTRDLIGDPIPSTAGRM